MSRTPIREALKALESEGLLEHESHVGFRTARHTLRDLIEAVDLRCLIEGHAAQLVASAWHPGLGPRLHDLADSMEDALKRYFQSRDPAHRAEVAGLELDFHRCIVKAAGNRLLLEVYDTGKVRIMPFADEYRSFEERRVPSHHDIVAALEQGDPQHAERTARDHLDVKSLLLRKHLGSVSVIPDLAGLAKIELGSPAPE